MGKGTIKTKAMTMAVAMSMVAGLCPSTVFAANSEDVAKVQDGMYTGTAKCTPDAAAGFDDATISASSDLDEYLIDSLKTQDAKINSWGVGTNLITSKDNPAFGGVYKLAAVKDADSTNFTPKIKLSENTEKVTNPGNKTVYRIYSKSTGKIKADLICLADEVFDPEETMIIFDPADTWKKTKVLGGTYELRELLVPVIKDGKSVYKSPSVMELRDYCKQEQNTLWDESRRFVNPQKVYVDLSQSLYDMKKALLEEMSEKEL